MIDCIRAFVRFIRSIRRRGERKRALRVPIASRSTSAACPQLVLLNDVVRLHLPLVPRLLPPPVLSFLPSYSASLTCPRSPKSAVPNPPGFLPPSSKGAPKNATALIKPVDLTQLRQQKAWELATAPAKNVPMQGPCSWLSGGKELTTSSVHDVYDWRRRTDLLCHVRVVPAQGRCRRDLWRREGCVPPSHSLRELTLLHSVLRLPYRRQTRYGGPVVPPAEGYVRGVPGRAPRGRDVEDEQYGIAADA